jgi:copper chaperone CopZ
VRVSFRQRLRSAFRYAFVEMMQDIGKWLLLGLVVAGLITVFVPDSFFALFADKPLLSMLLVLAFAVPMYLCATGSIPIAVALMLKGLSPGTALVLLMAGPAVNVASMLVISKVMGKKTLLFYLLSIVSGAIAFGLAIDYLLPREWFLTSLAHIHDCHAQGVSWFNLGCTLLMLLLLVNAFVLRYRKQDSCELPSGKNWVMMVKGMTCNHCKNNVEKAIMKVNGVEQVDINLADGRTVVTGSFDREAIKKSVEGIGFEVVEDD